MNTDEALKCLKLAQRYRDAGEYTSARKFAQKSINLFSTPEAVKLLSVLNEEAESSSKASPSTSKASGADSHPSASSMHSRTTTSSASGSSSSTKKVTYTETQVKLVRKVRNCKITDYYGILELEKSCEEADVKRAYRKLALQLHPDKNGAPGADEAFKLVSKAFQILSDPQKRAVYDQSGSDPESRFSGMASPGAAGGFGGGRQFEGEISPEELFNMFFGGGMGGPMGGGPFGGGPFGGGPVFTASFGPGGFRTTRVRPRANGAADGADAGQAQSPRSILLQLAPLLLLFFFSFLSSIPSLFTTPPPPDPSYAFSPNPPYTSLRRTSTLDIPYYVSPSDFSAHPIWTTIPESYKHVPKAGPSSHQLYQFERSIEKHWTNQMVQMCERERDARDRRIEAKSGWLGVGADWEAVKKIRKEKLESCETLKAKNIISDY